jgi:manganese transport protein
VWGNTRGILHPTAWWKVAKEAANHKGFTDEEARKTAHDVLDGSTSNKGQFARLMPFLGPAFIASVAYVDPGNIATNIQGGAKYGYLLLWVIVVSNLMAMLIQTLSAKLGIATGQNLAEMCRARFSKPVVWGMWLISEVVAMATDLAEFLGAALGFELLFSIPLWLGAILTAITTMLILSLERYGFRPLEAVITSLLGIIAVCYLVETVIVRPAWLAIAYHAVVPRFSGSESVLLASGILGATVMPHVIYLHSALTQGRIVTRDPGKLRRLFHFEIADIVIALGVAGLVNAAMLIMGAAAFHEAGLSHIATIEEAHRTLEPLLGKASSWVFAMSLLASGLSSSAVGTMSGQVVMKGFLQWKISVVLRRLITMAPALVAIIAGCDPTTTLVLSQVVLSFGIPFALVPLIMFTANRDLMGVLVNKRLTTVMAWGIAGAIISLNMFLLLQTLLGG